MLADMGNGGRDMRGPSLPIDGAAERARLIDEGLLVPDSEQADRLAPLVGEYPTLLLDDRARAIAARVVADELEAIETEQRTGRRVRASRTFHERPPPEDGKPNVIINTPGVLEYGARKRARKATGDTQ